MYRDLLPTRPLSYHARRDWRLEGWFGWFELRFEHDFVLEIPQVGNSAMTSTVKRGFSGTQLVCQIRAAECLIDSDSPAGVSVFWSCCPSSCSRLCSYPGWADTLVTFVSWDRQEHSQPLKISEKRGRFESSRLQNSSEVFRTLLFYSGSCTEAISSFTFELFPGLTWAVAMLYLGVSLLFIVVRCD
jgi:hypothetical protein